MRQQVYQKRKAIDKLLKNAISIPPQLKFLTFVFFFSFSFFFVIVIYGFEFFNAVKCRLITGMLQFCFVTIANCFGPSEHVMKMEEVILQNQQDRLWVICRADMAN